jgi:hypothetical protein
VSNGPQKGAIWRIEDKNQRKKPGSLSWAFSIHTKRKENEMSAQKGFYEDVKLHIQPRGKGVKLTIYLPAGASSNLFSEIKSSVRKKRVRTQAVPKSAA